MSYRKCTLNIWDTFCIGFHIFKKMSICFFCASVMKGNNSWILTSLNLYMKQQLHIHTFRFLIASLTISVPFALSTSHSPRNYIKKINILHTIYILHDCTTKLHSIHANLLKLYTLLKFLTLKYLTCIYLLYFFYFLIELS